MKPTHYRPDELLPTEAPLGHPFADPDHYSGDLALLNYLLQDLRVVVRQIAAGDAAWSNYDEIEWQVHGLQRRTVICDRDTLVEPETRLAVGFFGDRRASSPAVDIDGTELNVVGEFRHFPGIISYSSIELVGHQWANLVVHTSGADRSDWRHSRIHIDAAERVAPEIYHNVRIHNGCIPGGPIGSGTLVLERTKYWDYDVQPVWHASRELPGGGIEEVATAPGDPRTDVGSR
ncbi:MAG: hypothetical protein AAGA65_17795 [Actinomycetota bacterium]